ncbi:MAG: hypothetical protein Q4B88_03430 [Moraxella sp.]|nr:hypothetical protein [Moraxella sp.]
MVDSWEVWHDFKPHGQKRYEGAVWVGFDPSFTGDNPALAVIAPPKKAGAPYRILERKHLTHMPPMQQAQVIKKICESYQVEHLGIDTTGAGIAVAEHVKEFFPHYTPIIYSIESKTRMVLRAKELFFRRKLHFDSGYTDIAKAFIGIKQATTQSGNITLIAKRTKSTGHSDIAWAVMNALEKAPIASTAEVSGGAMQSRVKVYQ